MCSAAAAYEKNTYVPPPLDSVHSTTERKGDIEREYASERRNRLSLPTETVLTSNIIQGF